MKYTEIESVTGREVLDSRGNPTVEAEVCLVDGSIGVAKAPSGASTGQFEAFELRDNDKKRYGGKGTLTAAGNITNKIAPVLKGMDAADTSKIDSTMIALDGSENKSVLGANAILAASLACADAAANSLDIPLYKFIGGANASRIPVPMMNILNGGAHSANNVDIQEFMIMPIGAKNFKEGLRQCAEVFHELAKILKSKGLGSGVGDEGGYAPMLEDDESAIELILLAVTQCGFIPGKDFVLALDAAASEWSTDTFGEYKMPKSGKTFTTQTLIDYWVNLTNKYPIRSVEDPLDEEDWQGWRNITSVLGKKVQLVGDDFFVTNVNRLNKGIKTKSANAVLIKPNQIGTLTETMQTVRTAVHNGYRPIMSHRSGETEDTFIVDLAVGLNVPQIKTGAPSRSERVAKYNRLLKINDEITPEYSMVYGECF